MSNYSVYPSSHEQSQAVVGGEVTGPKSHFVLKAMMASLAFVAVFTGFLLFKGQSGPTTDEVGIANRTATVTITTQGFQPAVLTVSPGTTVTWVNNSATAHQVGANPYPSHSTLPELFSGVLNPHQSYSFAFTKTGTWLYQDDSNPLRNGSVVVK